ncbi:unnamed protein product [Paramecium sonneborni]|uniref:Uncharacterized protein n=1 Tax=Paramecium sonneborni TaxID=65129 RepID=A0A8S1R8V1_9CILI|nr:unnamed protein product [Paramecium sonneborni]
MKPIIRRAPESALVQSYVITLLDGTSSMNFEYDEILKAHKNNFDDLGDNQMKIQFTDKVHDFEPFQAAGSVDGDEKFDLTELEEMIEEVKKKKFQIQFVSVSIGSWFPNTISNQLRNLLHNSNFIEPLYHHNKDPERTEEEMFDFFDSVFSKIKAQTKVYQDLFETEVEVKLTLVSKPTNLLPAGALFVSEIEVTINGQTIKPTNNIFDKKKMVFDSASQALIIFASDPDNAIQQRIEEKFQEVQQFARDIGVEEQNQLNLQQQQLTEQEQIIQIQFKNAQLIVNQFAEGDIDIDQCTPETLTGLQASLSNPAADSILIIQIISQQLSVKEDFQNLNPQNILKAQKKKLNSVGCYARASAKMKQIEQQQLTYECAQIQMAKEIIINGLKKYQNLFSKDKNSKDVRQLLIEYYNSTLIELDIVFERLILAKVDEESYDLLKELNLMMKEVNEVKFMKKSLSPQEAIKFINKVLAHGQIQQSMAITEHNDEFDFLPESLKSQIRPQNDEREKILVAIFDTNESMKYEIDSALKNFDNEFSKIETIKLCWQNSLFSIIGTQQSFNNLIDLFLLLEGQYQFKTKKICLCLISDGQNEYTKMHKQLKSLKANRYLIQLSYITIGSSFHFLITNELDRMMQNRNLKGRPIVLNVPRQKTVGNFQQITQLKNSVTALNINQHFSKRFQDLNNLLLQEKKVIQNKFLNKSQIY